MDPSTGTPHNTLKALRLGIDTHQEAVVYMRADCPICRSEGFEAQARVRLVAGERVVIGLLNVIDSDLLPPGHIGLSNSAWARLDVSTGDKVAISHPQVIRSLSHVRHKIYDHPLDGRQLRAIINDIMLGRYADIHIATFLTACAGTRLSIDEIVQLTLAMVEVGRRLEWPDREIVVDKHCIGGLPGNRTSPIVVAIVAAAGLTMPKTSSRAITSPAGTADMMEVITRVQLDLPTLRNVVQKEGGCLAWGGNVNLSPVDDILIRVEKALDLDSQGQLIASVLSKKIAAGSTHVLIDIPVGPTAKVRSQESATMIANAFLSVGERLGIKVKTVITEGGQPVGRGIGPALEAADVIQVLQNAPSAPRDLRAKAVLLAGQILEMAGKAVPETGVVQAEALLDSGAAWRKFQAICLAQGGIKPLPIAPYRHRVHAKRSGWVGTFDNRKLALLAKLAGAPNDKAAGVRLFVKSGQAVRQGDPLLELHAETPGELKYALDYLEQEHQVIQIIGGE